MPMSITCRYAVKSFLYLISSEENIVIIIKLENPLEWRKYTIMEKLNVMRRTYHLLINIFDRLSSLFLCYILKALTQFSLMFIISLLSLENNSIQVVFIDYIFQDFNLICLLKLSEYYYF